MKWNLHDNVHISVCECGEHHYHLLKIGNAVYLQCGKCSKLTPIILDMYEREKLKEGKI